ncbi:endo-beta-N-acetylglucosaminidase [Streptomyces sp. VRA16 Mangrove soil]|uniref:endo-beta-N-acetylglucosaminidase n=1 Tax=Streptomyces sp. VRA16 Mangrove soil TaxID=2817434 RepID=UPI001A9D5AE0|nr:endo-beta-N-acetylglucosaminidase [Streptomyces sp. VRA16 Mangrove soil]MBO1335530.1 endo-beta-N-acetylglucosaminidase [Streptomyces sp. VRA16 Mangrove soil]
MTRMSRTPGTRPARRTVVLGSAAAAAALALPSVPARAAARGARAATANLQPYASYWFPDSLPSGTPGTGITWRSLKSWTAASDADLAFNRSTVPLAPRFTPVPVNTTARTDQARITSLVSFGPTASNPSQGGPTASYYALTHWAYIDELVFWGGSSAEGIVLAPNAPVVDAAHRNGVTVLGNIFLPPAAYGGQLQWTRDLVQKAADGTFPLAQKLVDVAVAYGFDGWFVNAETGGGDAALATQMIAFLKELKRLGSAHGLRIDWYDSMVESGSVSWQNALNGQNQDFFVQSDTFFVNFNWTASGLSSSAQLAESLGRDRYELWAGVDVESNGWNTNVDWDAVIPAGAAHTTSYGFYRPEWTYKHLAAGSTPGQFHAADDQFWTGTSLDPSRASTGSWRAPATAVADRSTVSSLPFGCSFNTGHGLAWYERGTVRSTAAWNQLGVQDRLPGRRWVTRTTGSRPSVTLDFADAWRGGSSLLVDGDLNAPVVVELHGTRLPLNAATTVTLAQRAASGSVTVEVGVALQEPDNPGDPLTYSFLPAGTAGGSWAEATVRLSSLGAGTIHGLALRLTGTGAVTYRLGALLVRDADEQVPAPSALKVDQASGDGQFRLSWRAASGHVRHYELSRVLKDGTRRFLTGTCANAAYVTGLAAERGERAATFELRAVGELYTTSAPITVTHTW